MVVFVIFEKRELFYKFLRNERVDKKKKMKKKLLRLEKEKTLIIVANRPILDVVVVSS